MRYQWNTGWSATVLGVFFVISPVLALVVRRKWRLAQIRRMEVMRRVRLAAAETERAEKEAAAIIHAVEKPMSAVNGVVIGMSNCAVCHNPTTTRCSRCKAVKYCSGTCQITHWRQGHKFECHSPLIVDHCEGQPTVSDLKGAQTERPEISGNGLGIEGKGLVSNDGFNIAQSVSNIVAAQSESSSLIDRRSGIEVKPSDTKGQPKVSDLKGVEDERPEIRGNGLGIEGKGYVTNDGFYVDQSVSNVVEAQSEPSVLVFSRSDIEAKPSDDTKRVETFSTAPVLSESNIYSKSRSENVEDGEKHFMSTSKGASIIDPLSSSCSTIHGSVEKPDKSMDARMSENAKEFSTMGSVSINHDKSKGSKSSVSYCEARGETHDLTAAETITRAADSTESQICRNIHLQLDSGLHFELDVKLSSMKSSSAAANPGRSDFNETVSLVVGNSGQVAKESNNEQLTSSSSNCLKDHLASVGHSKSFLGNRSLKENTTVSVKSVKVDSSVPNGNASSRKDVQPITPSSSLSRHGQSGHGKYNYKMLFPYDNFIRLYNSDKVAMHPCGLVNCGNSCYANVVLQCLAFTRPLAAFFLEGFHAKACPKIGWCFACEFETLLMKVKQGKSPFSPNGIISHIHDIGSNFGHGREEDAHEFLRYSIDALQSACLKEAGTKNVSELAEETTLIQLIFGGYLRSKIKCMRCQGKSERRERMMDLSIDIHGEIGTLEEALARFTAREILDGENKYKCGRCQSFERAKKQLTILEAPNVLTIALKRYQSGKYGKLNRMVRFSEYLNLAPYMRGSDDNWPVYRLYAVVVHSGHANATFSGHYVCYVKNAQGKWFKTDDSVVKQEDLQNVLSQGAYMLLYTRCSPRAPNLLRKEMARKTKSKELGGDVPNSAARSSSVFPHHRAHAGRRTDDPSPHDPFSDRLHRPPKLDSSSDVSSLFSCSDEGSSWSTESTKDSAASDDFTDYSLSPRRVSVSSDASSMDFKAADRDGDGAGEGRESLRFLYSFKGYRNLTEQVSSRSNADADADADWVNASGPRPNVLFRRTGSNRSAQTFY